MLIKIMKYIVSIQGKLKDRIYNISMSKDMKYIVSPLYILFI